MKSQNENSGGRLIQELFPELVKSMLEHGSIKEFEAGDTLFEKGTYLTSIFLPISTEINLCVSIGQVTQARTISTVHPYCAFGILESLKNLVLPCAGRAARRGEILVLPLEKFKLLRGQFTQDLHIFTLLSRSPAMHNLASWMIANDVSVPIIRELFGNIPLDPQAFAKQEALRLSESSIVFLHRGLVQLSIRFTNGRKATVTLSEGKRFTKSLEKKQEDFDFDVDLLKPCQFYIIPLQLLETFLPDELIEILKKDSWLDDGRARLAAVKVNHRAGGINGTVHRFGKVRELGYLVDISQFETDRQNCSPEASILMIAGVFVDTPINVSSISEELSRFSTLTLGRMSEILERHGVITRAFTGRFSDIENLTQPVLIFLNFKPVLLLRAKTQSCYILDPFEGVIEVDTEIFVKVWNGQALQISASPIETAFLDARKRGYINNPAKVSEKVFEDLFAPNRILQINIFGLGLIAEVLLLAIPFALHRLIDEVLIRRDFSFKWTFLEGIAICVVFVAVTEILRGRISRHLLIKTMLQIRTSFFKQLTQLPSQFLGESKSGETISRFELLDRLAAMTQNLRDEMPIILTGLVLHLAVLFVYSWELGLLAIFGLGFTHFFKINAINQRTSVFQGVLELRKQMSAVLIESLANFLSGKALLKSTFLARRTIMSRLDGQRFHAKMMSFGLTTDGIVNCMIAIFSGAAIAILVYKAEHRSLSVGAFLASCLYLKSIWRITRKFGDISGERRFLKIEQDVMSYAMKSENLDYSQISAMSSKTHSLIGKIQFDGVTYRHDRSGFSINDLRFTIQSGELVAIVGASGSGKSTIGRLIAGILKPLNGKIYYDDVDARNISAPCLRDQIGYMGQKPIIFTGTILENIAFCDDTPDLERIEEICNSIGANNFIKKLPRGLNHFLNPAAIDLSVGECTLICLARVLYKNPKVLVIDEVGSHIDPFSMKIVSDHLEQLMSNRSVIVVSQRLATLKKVDRILVVKNGYITENGTHSALMKNNREYSELFRSQMSS